MSRSWVMGMGLSFLAKYHRSLITKGLKQSKAGKALGVNISRPTRRYFSVSLINYLANPDDVFTLLLGSAAMESRLDGDDLNPIRLPKDGLQTKK
ncbi:hypothetical protein Hypma_003442 [Hypsizygus marmoreus]|uniref:Uncharacterized protein n=1 Tax=Hypsizygus marmoreus TaxID=39966 RepID=A0A369J207_HYPMA|nr:hypothetical protein Hypma_003442 [Hypsizygus marmoreus]